MIPSTPDVAKFLGSKMLPFFLPAKPVLVAFHIDRPEPFPYVVVDTQKTRHVRSWWTLLGKVARFIVYSFPSKYDALESMAGEDPLPGRGQMVLEHDQVDKQDGRGPLWSFRRDDLYWHKVPRNWSNDWAAPASVPVAVTPSGPHLLNNTWFRKLSTYTFTKDELHLGADVMTRMGFPTLVGGSSPQPPDALRGALTANWGPEVMKRWKAAVTVAVEAMEHRHTMGGLVASVASKKRVPTRPVAKWPLKQLREYAYDALERDSMSNPSSKTDKAFDKFLAGKMSRKELEHWAAREVEYRELTY